MDKPINIIKRGKRRVLIATNQAGTVIHTMIEQGSDRAYVYKDLVESDKAIEQWLETSMAINPADCIPYYG